MKKTAAFLLTLILMLTNLGAVLAQTVSAPPADQISANPNYAGVEYSFSAIKRGSMTRGKPNIIFTRAGIGKKSSTSVIIRVITDSDIPSAKIGGQLSVQRWINNSWKAYKSMSFWSYNTTRATISKVITVPSGYYYRLAVTHVATNVDGTSAKNSITSSVLIN